MDVRGAMSRAWLLALLLATPIVAEACECIPPIHVGDMRAAKHAVVVRVIGTGVPPDAKPVFGIANVQVLDRLRGDATPRRLRYSLGWCCPLRIEAGKTYIVFLDAPTDTAQVHLGNLVALWSLGGYDAKVSGRRWREVLAGKRELDQGHDDLQYQFLDATPPPPPPPGK
jgi:hypothetical protein